MDDPEPGRLNPFLLPLHGLLAAKHPQGEFVDPRLEHGPELPLHETGLAQPLLLIWGDLVAPSTSFHFDGGRGASPGRLLLGLRRGCWWCGRWQSLLQLPTARGALVLTGGGRLPFPADQPLLLGCVVEVPAGQWGQAPFEAAAVPVGAGLGALAARLRLQEAGVPPSAGVSPECPGAPSRGRRQWLQPDAFPPGVLVTVILLVHDRRLGSYLLGQAVEPLAHGGGQLVHGCCCCCYCCSVRGRDTPPPQLCPSRRTGTAPRTLPPAQGAEGTRDWRVIALPDCGIHRLCIKTQALHPEGKEKKEGRQKSTPLLRCPNLTTCCLSPLGECYCNPCLLRSRALGKKSRGEPHTSGWKAREGSSSSCLAMLASRCKCAVSLGGQTSSGKRSSSPGTSNSSTCRPITQWTATCSSHCLLTSLSSLIPHAAPAPGNIHEAIPFYWVAIGATTARRLCLPEPAPGLLKRATPGCQGCVWLNGRRNTAAAAAAARLQGPRCPGAAELLPLSKSHPWLGFSRQCQA